MNNWNMYIIYDHPRDFPNEVVCRRWEIGPGQANAKEIVITANTVDECREELFRRFPDLASLPVTQFDEPQIAEIYG